MREIEILMESLHLHNQINIEDIPNVDLYVDQIVQLFENTFHNTTRNENEKVLTKTMINNYAKGKLFFPIKNKKYSKEHIMLISFIYQLKGALSINDIKTSLTPLNEAVETDETFHLEEFYQHYLNITEKNIAQFQQEMKQKVQEIEEEATSIENKQLSNLLLLSSLVTMSNFYRRLAEKLVDKMEQS